MKRYFKLLLLCSIIFNPVFAADPETDCGTLHIQISNLTDSICVLTSQRIVHGNLLTQPPLSIPPNDSKRFDMVQTPFYGPEVVLSYQCGNESITFTSEQNLCALEAGNITGTILSPMPRDIVGEYLALIGSYWWGKPGTISWKIEELYA